MTRSRASRLVVLLAALLVAVAGPVDAVGAAAGTRTAPTARLDPRLAAVSTAARIHGVAAGLARARALGLDLVDGRLRLIAERGPGRTADSLAAAGVRVAASAGAFSRLLVAPEAIAALARRPGLVELRPPFEHEPVALSEGVATSLATVWQRDGRTGSGATVAVIDMGFASWRTAQSSGDLPAGARLVRKDFCGGAFETTRHGTAAAEIVHDMAPGATIHLICIADEVGLAQALSYVQGLKAAGARVIVSHSIAWFLTSRGDGSGAAGTPDAIVRAAAASGILWVNAAGNHGLLHWGGPLRLSGSWHLWSGGDLANTVSVAPGATLRVRLKWDEWTSGISTDLDLYLYPHDGGPALASSAGRQSGTARPIESASWTNTTDGAVSVEIRVKRYSGTRTPWIDLFASGTELLGYRTDGSVVEPASSPSALAVGAVCWADEATRPYSSRGPTIDGRTKPDLVGPDGTSTWAYAVGSGCDAGFRGTSAATPHVAGAAALVLAANPSSTPAQLRSALTGAAHDLLDPGPDQTTGAGALRLPPYGPIVRSAPSATFVEGSAGTVTLRAGGLPIPSLSLEGSLPPGLAFAARTDGTATLAGIAAAGSSGPWPVTLRATSTTGSSAQALTIRILGPVSFTSPDATSFTAARMGTFLVTTRGLPAAAIARTGALPPGVTLVARTDGTALLAGTPGVGSGGIWPLSLTATNPYPPAATQAFTLVVEETPAFTSPDRVALEWSAGGSVTVTTRGWPRPAIALGGDLSAGASFAAGSDGTATISVPPGGWGLGDHEVVLDATSALGSVRQTLLVRVAQRLQTISFSPPATGVRGTSTTLVATASSGLPVSFAVDASSATVCAVSGTTLTYKAVGSCVVTATQAGSGTAIAFATPVVGVVRVVNPTASLVARVGVIAVGTATSITVSYPTLVVVSVSAPKVLAGRTIRLQRRFPGGAWTTWTSRTLATASTWRNSRATGSFTPSRSASYRWYFPAGSGYASSYSNIVSVAVR